MIERPAFDEKHPRRSYHELAAYCDELETDALEIGYLYAGEKTKAVSLSRELHNAVDEGTSLRRAMKQQTEMLQEVLYYLTTLDSNTEPPEHKDVHYLIRQIRPFVKQGDGAELAQPEEPQNVAYTPARALSNEIHRYSSKNGLVDATWSYLELLADVLAKHTESLNAHTTAWINYQPRPD